MNLLPAQVIDLNITDYIKSFELQKKLVFDMLNGYIKHDVILILEHPKVFTLGKRGGRENLVVSEEYLQTQNIEIIQTERGGNITYHGPGQLVLYPIINLEKRKIGVSDFVYTLEELMIKSAKDFGVTAIRDSKNHGVWVKDGKGAIKSKLGSIGLSIKHGISFHGLALNVNLDLTPFSWINPCGMADVSMTSLENEIKKSGDREGIIYMKDVKEIILYHLKKIIGIELWIEPYKQDNKNLHGLKELFLKQALDMKK
ncbi:MAG: lipoyl(octanoyl) transferase LipB [Desulfamplus sp.]|nr:lipoyl(octanoyl) transferase LipB [Desulfamplus sp.]